MNKFEQVTSDHHQMSLAEGWVYPEVGWGPGVWACPKGRGWKPGRYVKGWGLGGGMSRGGAGGGMSRGCWG